MSHSDKGAREALKYTKVSQLLRSVMGGEAHASPGSVALKLSHLMAQSNLSPTAAEKARAKYKDAIKQAKVEKSFI